MCIRDSYVLIQWVSELVVGRRAVDPDPDGDEVPELRAAPAEPQPHRPAESGNGS